MKRFFISALLMTIASAPGAASARPLNWVHKGKKALPASSTKVEYHGTTAFSAEGRLYFPTPGHYTPAPPAHGKVHASRLK